MHRTFIQQTGRALLFVLVGIASLTFPSGSVLFWSLYGAITAIDGPWRSFMVLLVFAFVIELIGGLGIGARSLPFAITALLIAGGGRFLTLGPWANADRWSPAPAIRTWCVASIAGIMMSSVAGLFVVLFNGYSIRSVSAAIVDPRIAVAIAIVAGVALVLLRRIDVPFRTRTPFGS
ncbi:MAG TPA: hypothetical protein VJ553_04835 [Candidatus Paceibacterota bacterium]|nr:hypothetical protein [Candidatus Paceibacterota bacterium]